MAARGNRLVCAIDYGTTFTGVAFAVVSGDEVIDRIEWIADWPKRAALGTASTSYGQTETRGLEMVAAEHKVASEISYAAAPNRERQWGYDISENALKWQWTKMELDQQEKSEELRLILEAVRGMKTLNISNIDQSNGQALAYSKRPEDIVADYLAYVREYLVTALRVKTTDTLSTFVTDLVVTVPAIWSDRAIDRTCYSMRKAGFDSVNFPGLRDTIIMSEPEAAALYSARWLVSREDNASLVPGDCFVLCDAGGGTVDLISYQVRQVTPSLELEEVAIGTGDRCGATFINQRFVQWTKDRLGQEISEDIFKTTEESAIGSKQSLQPKVGNFLMDFESAKKAYDGSPMERRLVLPDTFAQINNNPRIGLMNGEIRLTSDDLEHLFEPSISRTLQLIQGQVGQVRMRMNRPRYIILSGGFGQSPRLQKEVHNYARQNGIFLKTTDNPWMAVALGAVTKGCEIESQPHVLLRQCRKHYGISSSQPFSSYKHKEIDAYHDPFTGEKRATLQMTWLIKKGDALLSNAPKHASIEICRRFGVRDNRTFKTRIISCEDDDVPQRHEDVPNDTSLSFWLVYDLTNISEAKFERTRAGRNGLPYFTANMTIEIRIEANIQFRVLLKGRSTEDNEEICTVTRSYD